MRFVLFFVLVLLSISMQAADRPNVIVVLAGDISHYRRMHSENIILDVDIRKIIDGPNQKGFLLSPSNPSHTDLVVLALSEGILHTTGSGPLGIYT